jgi:dihydroorotase
VATDHAPHAPHEKDVEYAAAPFGVIGLETALPIVLDLVREERLSALDAIGCLSTRPARVLGLRGGSLEVGAPADLVLVDPEQVWKVETRALCSKSSNSAFLGRELRGRALATWVGGTRVFGGDGAAR